MTQETGFNPYSLAEYFGNQIGEDVQAIGFYTEGDSKVIYDRGIEDFDLGSILENIRDQNLYVQQRADKFDDSVDASVHMWEDRCEMMIFGEGDEGFVAYLDTEVRQGSNLDSFANRCKRILNENY